MEASGVGIGNSAGSKTTQFKPGWKGGPGRPRAPSGNEPAEPATPLGDMRYVYNNPASKDKTPGQQRCRQLFDDDFKGFIALYMKLEDAHRAEAAAAATGDASTETAPSEKELRVEELAERLLAEWEEEETAERTSANHP